MRRTWRLYDCDSGADSVKITKWWSELVEGLLSRRPTLYSFFSEKFGKSENYFFSLTIDKNKVPRIILEYGFDTLLIAQNLLIS